MKYFLVAAIGLTMLLMSCKTIKYTPTNYDKEQLSFGSGGGFTGAVDEFTLLSNGQLFYKNGEVYKELGKLKENQALQIFENYKMLKMDKRIMNDPGNMYYFIKRKTPDTFHKAVWGKSPNVDKRITIFYTNLMRLVKPVKHKMTSNKK